MINKAIQFTTIAHSNQFRKGSNIPYILHCLEAGSIAESLSTSNGEVDEELIAAAILHDTVEDSNVTLKALAEMFSKRVANLVNIQSEDKSKSWEKRKQETIDFLTGNESKDIEIVILADKLSNIRAIYRDFNEIGDDIWVRFNAKKESQHWYYLSIGDSMKYTKDTKEYDEYMNLIDRTFGYYF